MRTRVKICGITRAEDAAVACRAGADAIGLVFYAPSPRNVDVTAAGMIARSLQPFVTVVGLFVDPDAAVVEQVLRSVRLDLLQFHGEESPQFCARFGVPYIKAVRVRPEMDLIEYARRYDGARGLLLDAYVSGMHGGTGTHFDWGLIPADIDLPLVLSGGLTPQNVGEGIRRVRPWGVDVSSGVEAAGGSKGLKDPARIRDFMAGVRDADA